MMVCPVICFIDNNFGQIVLISKIYILFVWIYSFWIVLIEQRVSLIWTQADAGRSSSFLPVKCEFVGTIGHPCMEGLAFGDGVKWGGDSRLGRSQMRGTWKNCPLRPKMSPNSKVRANFWRFKHRIELSDTALSSKVVKLDRKMR